MNHLWSTWIAYPDTKGASKEDIPLSAQDKASLVLYIWHLQVKQGEKGGEEGAQGIEQRGRGTGGEEEMRVKRGGD